MNRLFYALLLLSLTSCSSVQVADDQATEAYPSAEALPALFEHGRVFVLPVTTTGDTLRLFTDTGGSPISSLGSHVADRLGLETEEVTQGGQTGKVAAPPAFRGDRSIPPTPVYSDSPILAFLAGRVAVRPLGDADYDGMLGQSWHRDRVWTFDYASGRLLLHPSAEALAFDPAHTVSLGFQTDSTGRRVQHFPSVEATVDGQTFPWLLDTGATLTLTDTARKAIGGPRTRATSFVTARTFDRWRERHPEWPVTEGADANVDGEPIITVPEVIIAGHTVGPVLFVRRADANYDDFMSQWMDRPIEGALGGSLFQHFVLTVDYPGARAHFERIE